MMLPCAPFRVAAALLAGLLLAGCGTRGGAQGTVIGASGMRANTPEAYRDAKCRALTMGIDAGLGPHWRSDVALSDLPIHRPGHRGDDEGWRWERLAVQVTLVGDGAGDLLVAPEVIRDKVLARLRPVVDRPSLRLTVRTSQVVDAVRFAALAGAAGAGPSALPAPAPAPIPPPSTAVRRYTVQAGDTLAEISAVFYGSPEHWRRIASANGIAAAGLQPGMVLVIP